MKLAAMYSLRPALRTQFSFSRTSLLPVDESIQCFGAHFGGGTDVQTDASFFSYKNCVCRSGYHGKPPQCRKCDGTLSHAQCSFSSDALVETLDPGKAFALSGNILADAGYYASPSVDYESQMQNAGYPAIMELCPLTSGTSPCVQTVTRPCSLGYSGRLCSKCENGYYALGAICTACPAVGTAERVLFVALLIACSVVIVVWSLFSGQTAGSTAKVLIFFTQGLSFLPSPLPMRVYHAVNLGFGIVLFPFVSDSCFFPSDDPVLAGLLQAAVLPAGVCGGVLSLYTAGRVTLFLRRRSQAAVLTGWLDRCCRSCCFLLVFFYMFMTRKILTPLTCERDAGDGEEYLTALPFAKCSSTDRGIASILLVTHVIGLPVAMIFICRRLMRQPDFKERALYIFAVLFGGYAPRMRYFEAFYLLRRVSFVAAASLIPTFSALGSLSVALILGISLVLTSRFQPFRSSTDNLWDISSLSLLLVNVVANVRTRVAGTYGLEAMGVVLLVLNALLIALMILALSSRILLKVAGTIRHWVSMRIGNQNVGRIRSCDALSLEMEPIIKQPLLE
jgi:hypothetical protein